MQIIARPFIKLEHQPKNISMEKKLERSISNKMVAGVCAGLAKYLGWDADKTRIVYVLVSILSAAFPGLLIYLILWFVMPEEKL